MDFMKVYDQIDRYTLDKILVAMNFIELISELVTLLYNESEVIMIINNVIGLHFPTRGGVMGYELELS